MKISCWKIYFHAGKVVKDISMHEYVIFIVKMIFPCMEVKILPPKFSWMRIPWASHIVSGMHVWYIVVVVLHTVLTVMNTSNSGAPSTVDTRGRSTVAHIRRDICLKVPMTKEIIAVTSDYSIKLHQCFIEYNW